MIEERVRRSARVLLLDPAERILLFSVTDDGATRWFAPGGGLVDGESYAEAAVPQLRSATDILRPAGLPDLLTDLLRYGRPAEPIPVQG